VSSRFELVRLQSALTNLNSAGSSSFSTSTPPSTDKKDFVISTLSKKVIDLSKQVKEQNEQLGELSIRVTVSLALTICSSISGDDGGHE